MLNQDSWDEALLGFEKKTIPSSPRALLPGPTIFKSLVPLAGLLLALTITSGFELIDKVNLLKNGFQDLGKINLEIAVQTSNSISVGLESLNALFIAAVNESRATLSFTEELSRTSGLAAVSALVSLGEWFNALIGRLLLLLNNTIDFLVVYSEEVGARWRDFLSRKDVAGPATEAPMLTMLDNEIRIDLKEIKSGIAEILKKLNQPGSALPASRLPSEGIVVIPKINNATPESLKAKVSGMFSDQINIALDESGQAGVITPIFRRGPGEDYLFVLTPITP